jgi:hypothetical protein
MTPTGLAGLVASCWFDALPNDSRCPDGEALRVKTVCGVMLVIWAPPTWFAWREGT